MLIDFLEEDSVAAQWFWRIVATLAIAVAYHWWSSSDRTGAPDLGNRLQAEWSGKQKQASSSSSSSSFTSSEEVNSRSALLDRLEKESKSRNIVHDGIENEAKENISHEEAQKVKPSAPLEELDVPLALQEEIVSTASSNRPTPPFHHLPPIRAKQGHHPGIDGFLRWYETEASLYRIYTVGRSDGVLVHPPFIPKSERGHINLKLKVTNKYRRTLSVYWVDYKGREIHKGNVPNGGIFHQTTWIGHPWIFREKDSGDLLCHYIPYKVIPTTELVPTVDSDDPEVGIHQFSIVSLGQRPQQDEGLICFIQDSVFPTDIQTPHDAAAWTFHEMSRMDYRHIATITKYFTNIVLHPTEPKYRQIRISHKRFFDQVWATAARGLFLSSGFVEEGAYAEMGSAEPLKRERVQDLSTILFYIEKWKRIQERPAASAVLAEQPAGADGYGRANFGRHGMNGQ